MNNLQITVDLTEDQAYHLALFLKRVTHNTCERLSDPTKKSEPHKMMDALMLVQHSLDEIGISPR